MTIQSLDWVLCQDSDKKGKRISFEYTKEEFQKSLKGYLDKCNWFLDQIRSWKKVIELQMQNILNEANGILEWEPDVKNRTMLIVWVVETLEYFFADTLLQIEGVIKFMSHVINNIGNIDYEYALTFKELDKAIVKSIYFQITYMESLMLSGDDSFQNAADIVWEGLRGQ